MLRSDTEIHSQSSFKFVNLKPFLYKPKYFQVTLAAVLVLQFATGYVCHHEWEWGQPEVWRCWDKLLQWFPLLSRVSCERRNGKTSSIWWWHQGDWLLRVHLPVSRLMFSLPHWWWSEVLRSVDQWSAQQEHWQEGWRQWLHLPGWTCWSWGQPWSRGTGDCQQLLRGKLPPQAEPELQQWLREQDSFTRNWARWWDLETSREIL